MFDLSLIELLFVAVIALLVIGPKDLPKVLAQLLRLFRQFKSAVADVKSQIDEVVDASSVREAEEEIQTIIDENGQIQRVYDLSDFLDEEQTPRKASKDGSPLAEHDESSS